MALPLADAAPGDDDLPPEAYAAALAGLPGMGPARLAAVLGATASPAAAWSRVLRGEPWREPRVAAALGRKASSTVEGWRAAAAATSVSQVWQRIVEFGVGVALRGGAGYPPALVDDIEPPAVLFHLGDPSVIEGPRVAVIGTRRCTGTGSGVAFEMGRDLATEGVAVVSGLAAGIDAAAHRGALAAGSTPPIGVVGCGLDIIYPASQAELWRAVIEAGVLLGEAPLGCRPERWRFPARNRIIAGLADLVVVVESHRGGGSFHTVDEADRRDVDVMAVPGSVRNVAAAGVNALLVEGRAPVRDAGDVLLALGLVPTSRPARPDPRPAPSGSDRQVLEAMGWQPATLDQLAVRTGFLLPDLAAALERLEAAGWAAQQGGWYEQVAAGVPKGPA
jgi:DNA processing protein